MKKIRFFLVAFVLLAGLLLSACCILGDACESGIYEAVDATQTAEYNATAVFGGQQLAIQLTEQAK